MMLRTYRECAKVVTIAAKHADRGRSQAVIRSRSNPRVRSNAHRNKLISRSNPPLIPYMSRRGGLQLPLIGALLWPVKLFF